jgi:threonine dehydrogenase-like Zn-dependent dehydrogenase
MLALHPSTQVDPTVIVSHQFPMTQWQEAFDTLMAGTACKIVVDAQT